MKKLLDKATFKNITCEVYANGESADGIYIKPNGSFSFDSLHDLAYREAYLTYNSPKHNKRKKKVTTITIYVEATTKANYQRIIARENNWVIKESKRLGPAQSGSIYTMLRNKGYQ